METVIAERPLVDYTWRISSWLAVITSFGISWARISWRGRAAAEMTYDDVMYAMSGNRLARSIEQIGLLNAATSWVREIPHAPIADLLSATASLLGGPSTPRIYFINMLFVGCLGYFAISMTLKTDFSKTIHLLALVIVSPLGFFFVDQFRPDPAYSVVLLFFVSSTIRAVRCTDSDRSANYARYAGLSVPLLILIKPSFFVFTGFALLGVAAWLLIVGSKIGTRSLVGKIVFPALKVSVVPLAAVSFWVSPSVIAYVIANTIGVNSSVWAGTSPIDTVSQSLKQSLSLVLPLFMWALLTGVALIILLIGRKVDDIVDSLAYIIVGGLSLIPVGMTRYPSIFFGLVPVSMMLAASAHLTYSALRYLRSRPPTWRSATRDRKNPPLSKLRFLLASFGPILVVITALWFPFHSSTPSSLLRPISINGNVLSAVMADCQNRSSCNTEYTAHAAIPPILVTLASEVSPDSLQWEAILKGYSGNIQRLDFLTDLNGAISKTRDAKYVVVLAAGADVSQPRLPINQIQIGLNQFLGNSREWTHIPTPLIDQQVKLYAQIFP